MLLTTATGKVGQRTNEEKTKYTIVKRPTMFVYYFQVHVDQQQEIQIGKYNFEIVNTFKYIKVELNSQSDHHKGIKLLANVENKYIFVLTKIFKSLILSKTKNKQKIKRTTI